MLSPTWEEFQEKVYAAGGDDSAELLCRGIRTLNFPNWCTKNTETQTRNALAQRDLVFVAELARMSEQQVLNIRRIGGNGLQAIKEALAEVGLKLGTHFDDWEGVKARCDAVEAARRERVAQAKADKQAAAAMRESEFHALMADPAKWQAFVEQAEQHRKAKLNEQRRKARLLERVLEEVLSLRSALAGPGNSRIKVERLDDSLVSDLEAKNQGEWNFIEGVVLNELVAITFSKHYEVERWRPRGYVVFNRKGSRWSDGSWHKDLATAVLEAVHHIAKSPGVDEKS